jgi:hypothetical protein
MPVPRVGLVQSGPHHHIIENLLVLLHDIAEKLLIWRYFAPLFFLNAASLAEK